MRNVSALCAIGLALLLPLSLIASGCQSRCSEEDLGTIVHEVPEVPGSEKPFPMPELDPKAKSDEPDPLFPAPGRPPSDSR